MKRAQLIFVTLLVQLVVGEDLYWRPTSNWGDPDNWSLGREPCGGDIATFSSLPSDAVVFVNTDVKVRSLQLPANGRLVLNNDITIQFSEDFSCTVDMDSQPMAADVQENNFIGAVSDYWECADNWLTEDNFPAEHPPCGSDNAFFDQGSAFSFVRSNESITVRSVTVRGETLQSLSDLTTKEFQLEVTIKPECAESPSLCPCPSDAGCPSVSVVPGAEESRGVNGGVVAGVVVVIVLILVAIVIVLVVLGIILYLRRRTVVPYAKDELVNEEEADDKGGGGGGAAALGSQPQTGKELPSYDNPVYDSTPLSEQMIGFEIKASLDAPPDDVDGGGGHTPKLNKYERF